MTGISTKTPEFKEDLKTPANFPPGNDLKSKIRYWVVSNINFMVFTVLRDLVPWLKSCSGKVLEVGCGAQPYRHLVPANCQYQGIDNIISKEFNYKTPDTLYYTGNKFPITDNSVDHLFHTEVLEHVFDTTQFLHECHRVLKNGGSMHFSTPFSYRYHHVPNDYWRFTPEALRIMLENAGFKQMTIIPRGTDITVACHKIFIINCRLFAGNWLKKIWGIIILPLSLLALLIGHLSMRGNIGSYDDCLGYNITAVKA